MKDIDGMSILITGGGSGIGSGTAKYFCERGARVTICGRRLDKVEAVAAWPCRPTSRVTTTAAASSRPPWNTAMVSTP